MTKKISSVFLSLCFVVSALCAVALVMPASKAFAGTEGTAITQDSFEGTTQYRIPAEGSYYLDADVKGSIVISGLQRVTLDLNGHTLDANGAEVSAAISIDRSGVTIKDGSVKGSSTSGLPAIQIVSNGKQVDLINVNASSTNAYCLEVAAGGVHINGGSYEATGKSVIRCSGSDTTQVYSKKTDSAVTYTSNATQFIDANPASSNISLPEFNRGSSLSQFPLYENDGSYTVNGLLADSNNDAIYKSKSGTYQVKDASTARDDAMYAVNTEVDDMGLVYFEDKVQAQDLAGKLNKEVISKCEVSFDTNGGTPESIDSKYAWAGDKVKAPEEPTRENYDFKGWYTTDGALFDFDNTPIESDLTLKAKWAPKEGQVVADVNGGEQYASIQDAVDAAQAGDTVNLLVDTTEVATINKDITLNLNNKILTVPDGLEPKEDGAITVDDAKVVIKDGTIETKDSSAKRSPACVRVPKSAEKADLTFKNTTLTAAWAPVVAYAGQVKFEGNDNKVTANAAADYALYLGGSVEATINGGEFKINAKEGATDNEGCIYLEDIASLDIYGGTFNSCVKLANDTTSLKIYDGKFACPENAADVQDSKVFYKAQSSDYYEVVTSKIAREGEDGNGAARWVVTDASVDPETKVYAYDQSDADSYFAKIKEASEKSTIHKLHKVKFVSQSEALKTLFLESDIEAYGEFPEVAELEGYTFDGWYVNDTKVSAEDTPNDDLDYDVAVKAAWNKDAVPGDDSDDDSESDDEDATDSDSGSDSEGNALPDTGDATGLALCVAALGAVAGVAALRRPLRRN